MPDLGMMSMDAMLERFVREYLGHPERFARRDIEDWLETQRNAQGPDCNHTAEDPSCTWCRITRRNLLNLTDMKTARLVLDRCATPVSLSVRMPRNALWKAPAQFLSTGAHDVTFHVGRDRFIVMHSRLHPMIIRMRDDDLPELSSSMIFSPLGLNSTITSCAIADVLLAEWANQAVCVNEARAFLVNMLSHQIQVERARAVASFDPEAPHSAEELIAFTPTQH